MRVKTLSKQTHIDIADVRREHTTQHDGHTEASEAVRPQRREAVG